MKFQNKIFFYKEALNIAVEKENVEIVKLLLASGNIDVNFINISK